MTPWLILTNGKDTPIWWDGYNPTFERVNWNYPGFITCKWLAYFNGHVLMGAPSGLAQTPNPGGFPDVIVSNTGGPQNIAWSDAAQVNEWLAGTAGEVSLFDIDGSVQTLVPLQGQYIAVYGDNSIHLMSYVGGAQIFVFQKCMSQTALVGPRAVCDLGYNHVFMSQDNMFVFDGSTRLTPVMDTIHQTYRNELASQRRFAAFCLVDKPRRRAFFSLPVGNSAVKSYQLDYNLAGFLLDPKSWTWTPQQYSSTITCFGTATLPSTVGILNQRPVVTQQSLNWTFPEKNGVYTTLPVGLPPTTYTADSPPSGTNIYIQPVDPNSNPFWTVYFVISGDNQTRSWSSPTRATDLNSPTLGTYVYSGTDPSDDHLSTVTVTSTTDTVNARWSDAVGTWADQEQVWGIPPEGITNFFARCFGDSLETCF